MKRGVTLSERERQVVGLLLQGAQNDDIGRELGIAERTVKAHLNRMFVKFGIKAKMKRVVLATLLYEEPPDLQLTTVQLRKSTMKVVKCVACGQSNREIAEQMKTTEHVIKNYLRVAYDRIGISNRVEIALWYISHFGRKGKAKGEDHEEANCNTCRDADVCFTDAGPNEGTG